MKVIPWLAVALVLSQSGSEAGVPSPAEVHVPARIEAVLQQQRPEYLDFQRGGDNATAVPGRRIPEQVRRHAADWVARVLRSPWVPPDGAGRFEGEKRVVQYIPPDNVDYLFLDYAAAGSSFRLAEDGTALSVLWANPNITPGDDPGKTVVLLAQILLKVPDAEASKMRAEMKELPGAGVPLFCGRVTIPREPLPEDEWVFGMREWNRQWYHDMFVWLADGCFYVSVPELTGRRPQGPEDLAASPGYRPRFVPAGDASGAADPPTGAPPAADD
jgi:hypothetical protein